MSFNSYGFAFAFWSLLTTEREDLPGGIALANLEVPFLLANAAWYPKVGELKTIAEWYAKRSLPPALIIPASRDGELERVLQESQFALEETFAFTPISASSFIRLNSHTVEQASWLQSRVTAELLATHFGQEDLGVPISQTLSRAMQNQEKIRNYLAYQDKPMAATVTFERDNVLVAMLTSNFKLFTQTLLEEAATFGLGLYVFETSKNPDAKALLRLERWSIQ